MYTLPVIVVRARRPSLQEELDRLPGEVTVLDLEPLRHTLTTTAEVLDRVAGLHVADYGGLGTFSTVSIRGAGANQVSIYVDGVPLGRAGLGITNLSELPFASLDRIEVYRGWAPAEFAGAGFGGVINLVTRQAAGTGRPAVTGGAGSYDTRRLGVSQHLALGGMQGLVVADLLQSQGDFSFLDDNGTPDFNLADDEVVARRNNWLRSDEVLVKLRRPLAGGGDLQLANQLVRRRQGVPGLPSRQATQARLGTTYDVTSASLVLPRLGHERTSGSVRLFHEWRRDTFADPADEIGLGLQDNDDRTRVLGAHATLRARLPWAQAASLEAEARRETYLPRRGYPQPARRGPEQRRTLLELALEHRIDIAGRLEVASGGRASRESDAFAGDLRTPYSQRPAQSEVRTALEPRLGASLRLGRGLRLEASTSRYHRTPGFLELFGDGGSVAGSSDLQPESGINRDYGLVYDGVHASLRCRFEAAHFRNDIDDLITFLPQSQRTFVARNIGAVRARGEEWSWAVADARPQRRFRLEGNLTVQRATDVGVDISWYAGKAVPGRPERQLYQRVGVRAGALELGYTFEHIGSNYLNRWNRDVVARRDLHGLDVRAAWRGLDVQVDLRNLTGEQVADVAGFPLPGRTTFVTGSYRF